jgi:nucleotide-binding universal stress UspA family protein
MSGTCSTPGRPGPDRPPCPSGRGEPSTTDAVAFGLTHAAPTPDDLLPHVTAQPLVLAAAVLLLGGVLLSKTSSRFGVPSLLLFLVLGMAAGSEGLLGIEFDDFELAQGYGVVALAFILFAGGLTTDWSRIRPVLAQGVALASVGVLLSAVALGALAWAERWSTGAGMALALLHATYPLPEPEARIPPTLAQLDELAYLTRVARRLEAEGHRVRRLGGQHPDPAAAIVEAAAERPGSLVAMASADRGPLAQVVVGSTTAEVLRRSPVPVLLASRVG